MSEPIKAGDKLVMTTRYGFDGLLQRKVVVVDRVTPSGIVKIGEFQLNADLSWRGRKNEFSRDVAFQRCTPEMEIEIARENTERGERNKLLGRIEAVRWRDITLEKLRQVAAIVAGETR
jgi:hypothetical protein